MPHSPDLIRSICRLLEKDYDPARHEYIIERPLPGTRMFPDIAITKKSSTKILCVVEVGYTRPEKLTDYRHKLKIPDVRWYDKQGQLHVYDNMAKHVTVVTTTEKRVKLSIAMVPRHEMAVYEVTGQFQCVSEYCTQLARIETCSKTCASPCGDCLKEETECCKLCPETCYDCFETILNSDLLRSEVSTTVVTDRVKAFFACYCDVCRSTWLANSYDDRCESVVTDLKDLKAYKFGNVYGAMTRMPWDDACQHVKARYGIDLDYDAGRFLDGVDDTEMRRCMTAVAQEAAR